MGCTTAKRLTIAATLLTAAISTGGPAGAQGLGPVYRPEQTRIVTRNPDSLPSIALPPSPSPPTVSNPLPADAPVWNLSLDDTIRVALENTGVVRIVSGLTAVSSGQTIYDVAVTNTEIDRQQARFDPRVRVDNNFDRIETPGARFPTDPNTGLPDLTRAELFGSTTDGYHLRTEVAKTLESGGNAALGVVTDPLLIGPDLLPLNRQARSFLELSLNQPLLQGAGFAVNQVPIVVARINTDLSYFQYKGVLQDQVQSLIDGYWQLVAARVTVWAREQQVDQSDFALRLAQARKEAGFARLGDVAQARTALANFRATLIEARAVLLDREAALRNALGLPPYEQAQMVPTTPPTTERLRPDWQPLVQLAEQRRPDVIEFKLILEADEQLLLQANNQARPRLDAVALYRWNGLEGTMPNGDRLRTGPGEYTDWLLGVNFSVPLGLREGRASLRRQELVLARDQAFLEQSIHQAIHDLALSVRRLDQFYEQYRAYQESRIAARLNLEQQLAEYQQRGAIYLDVLQAITAWGNAVSSEAQALALYNSALAELERQTGTILETHGIRFYEERFASIGPLGRLGRQWIYPAILSAQPTAPDRYPRGQQPAERTFDLEEIRPGRRPIRPQPLGELPPPSVP